jgi:hypothetical protein
MSWLRTVRLAAARTLISPALWPVALAGFLARGGIVIVCLPIVVVPSLVGLGTLVGPASLTPNGPTAGFLARIVLVAGIGLAALIVGTIVGAAAEIGLVGPNRPSRPGLLGRVTIVRLAGLVPIALALALGLPLLGQATYLELTEPSNLTDPIVLRVAGQVPGVVALIALAWLVGESWAGLAVRLLVTRGAGVRAALSGAVGLVVRRPLPILVAIGLPLLVLLATLGLILLVLGWSWGLARAQLLGPGGPAAVAPLVGGTLVFMTCWTSGLAILGGLATWRSLSLTLTVGEDHRGSVRMSPERATL